MAMVTDTELTDHDKVHQRIQAFKQPIVIKDITNHF